MKYQRSTGLPVFLVLRADQGRDALFRRRGAAVVYCCVSAIAGRVNAGLFFIQCASGGKATRHCGEGFI